MGWEPVKPEDVPHRKGRGGRSQAALETDANLRSIFKSGARQVRITGEDRSAGASRTAYGAAAKRLGLPFVAVVRDQVYEEGEDGKRVPTGGNCYLIRTDLDLLR